MFGLGFGEIAIILFIALIFIGPKKLPELARGLGKGMREFQNAAKGLQDQINNPESETKDQVLDQPAASEGQPQARGSVAEAAEEASKEAAPTPESESDKNTKA